MQDGCAVLVLHGNVKIEPLISQVHHNYCCTTAMSLLNLSELALEPHSYHVSGYLGLGGSFSVWMHPSWNSEVACVHMHQNHMDVFSMADVT